MMVNNALTRALAGREAELDSLLVAWEQVQAGEGKLMLISGECGVGKMRLLEVFRARLESEGVRVVRGHCIEGCGVAYQPWREVLPELMPQVEEASEAVVKRTGPVLATLFPDLWERPCMTDAQRPVALDPKAEQLRLNDTIVQVLRMAASSQPIVIVIEGGQWADEATLVLTDHLAQVLGHTRLLVCVSYCDDEIEPDHCLVALAGDQVQRVQVAPLSQEAIADLVWSELGMKEPPPTLVERVWQVTRGNAFFARELVCALMEEGEVLRQTVDGWQLNESALEEIALPRDISQLARHCLSRSSEETRLVLGWAALVGLVFWGGVLEEIGHVSEAQVGVALTEGLGRGLIVERPASTLEGEREYAFANPLVRGVCLEGVPQEAQRKLHSQIAMWLVARGEDRTNQYLGFIADHFEQAGEREQAINYLRQVGERAASQFAGAEAVSYLSRALELLAEDERAKQYDLLWIRERVYELQGAQEAQRQDLLALKALAEEMGNEQQRCEAALRRAIYADGVSDYPASIAAAREAIESAQAVGDVSAEVAGYIWWGRALWQQGNVEQAKQPLKQALDLAQGAGLRESEARSMRNLATIFQLEGYFAQAIAYNEQALHIFRELGVLQDEIRIYNNLGIIYSNLGSYIEAKHYLDQAVNACREIGHKKLETSALEDSCALFHRLGDDEIALEYGQQSFSVAEEIQSFQTQSYVLMYIGHALVGLDRLDEATRAYHRSLNIRRGMGQTNLTMEVLAGLIRVSLAKGDLAQAQSYCEEVLTYLETSNLDGTEEPFLIYLTCYHALRANQDARADEVLRTAHLLLLERADRIGDKDLRRLYLEKVAAHKEILDRVGGQKDIKSAVVYVADKEAERKDERKPKDRLVKDLVEARRRVAMLGAARVRYKQVEEKLWQSEKHFRSIAETTSEAVIIFNAGENIFFWNKAARDIFGYWVSEVKGKLLASILTEEFQQLLRREMRQVVATGISELMGKKIEVMAIRKNGANGALEEFPLELALMSWRMERDVFFTAMGHDIMERKQAQEALERAYAEVEKRVEERTAELQRATAERELLQQEIIQAQHRTLQELSTPIIPVVDGIIVMPLIGSIDSMRARDITRNLLAGIREHQAEVVILDITGVDVVDSGVASHLNKTIQAARLKGAHTIVTGISDVVAETIVDLGIDWAGIETVFDLQTGLVAALNSLGIKLTK
jgi:PAS domain S-box-containing protein